ncbi:MAG: GCN5-related N-acetyltransferase, partial [Frankiales bacterium]|nr:GCN5-related N-acetyltransferase [Frankiales bacterium]
MLTLTRGLTGAELDDIAALEARVLAADGGRLKLEPQVLAGRSGERVDDVLVHENGRLVGFLGIYDFGDIELSGMVDPAARRRGHGAALLDAALTECRSRAAASVLLVVPRTSEGGDRKS